MKKKILYICLYDFQENAAGESTVGPSVQCVKNVHDTLYIKYNIYNFCFIVRLFWGSFYCISHKAFLGINFLESTISQKWYLFS